MSNVVVLGLSPDATQGIRASASLADADVRVGADPEALLAEVRRYPQSFHAVLLGARLGNALEVAQRLRSLDGEVGLVLVAARGERDRLRETLLFTPFLGRNVQSADESDVPGIVACVRVALEQATGARRHRALLRDLTPVGPGPVGPVHPNGELLARLLEHAPVGVVAVDRALAVVAANATAQGLLGGRLALGQPLAAAFSGDEARVIDAHVRAAVDAQAPSRPAVLTAGDRALDVTVTPLRGGRGGASALVVLQDVTWRAEAERETRRIHVALRASEERYRVLVEGADEGILLVRDGGVRYANPAAARILGVPSADDLVGTALDERLPALAPGLREVPGPDGRPILLEIAERDVPLEEGIARQVVLRDVSERARMQAELLQAHKLESLGLLAGGVAHDFNNLLTGILGYAEIGLRHATDDRVRRALEQVRAGARQSAELARAMLAYAGRGRLKEETVDVAALVREVVDLLRAALSKDTRLEVAVPASTPTLRADAGQLRQVVLNLVTNAAEALPERVGVVRVAVTAGPAGPLRGVGGEEVPAGEYVLVEVADDGVGMDAETRARMFDPFFTTKFTGRGLGLAAVLGIVHAHRGALQVDSEPGRGTRVRVWLPASAEETESFAVSAPARAPGRGTLLVVDDEATVRDVACAILQDEGHAVTVAVCGEDALATLDRVSPDLALIDLTMPGMDGRALAGALRARLPGLPIVVWTGHASEAVARELAALGVVEVVQKPFLADTLLEVVGRVLAGRPTRPRSS